MARKSKPLDAKARVNVAVAKQMHVMAHNDALHWQCELHCMRVHNKDMLGYLEDTIEEYNRLRNDLIANGIEGEDYDD